MSRTSLAPCASRAGVLHRASVVLCLVLAATDRAGTQVLASAMPGTGTVDGVVLDAAGAPVRSARVRVQGQTDWIVTNTDGSYHIPAVPSGARIVQFVLSDDLAVSVAADVGAAALTVVDPVVPLAASGGPALIRNHGPSPVLAGFGARARHGSGHYFTRTDLLARARQRLSDVLRSVPGLTVHDGVVETAGMSVSVIPPLCDGVDIYVDGVPAGNDGVALTSLDTQPLAEFGGVEVYGRGEAPVLAPGQRRNGCASVFVWTLAA